MCVLSFSKISFMDVCLSQGFYSCTNIMTKKQVREEKVCSAYTSTFLFISKGSQDWNLNRWGSRSWCRGNGGMLLTGLPPLACSACSLIEPRLPAQRWYHPQWALPTWSLIERMSYSWISWRHFLNWSSFLCDNSSCVKFNDGVFWDEIEEYSYPLSAPCFPDLFSISYPQIS